MKTSLLWKVHSIKSVCVVALTLAVISIAFLRSGVAETKTPLNPQQQTPLYTVVDLGPLGGDSTESLARALNRHGQVTGRSFTADGSILRATFWTPTGGQASELIGGSSAYGINDNGEMSGCVGEPLGPLQGVYWPNASSPAVPLPPPGAGLSYRAFGINATGQMLGHAFSKAFSFVRLVYWANSSTAPVELPGLPGGLTNTNSSARRNINDAGQMVGTAFNEADTEHHAVFYPSAASAPIDLGTLGGDLDHSDAYGLNNSGQIVGSAYNDDFSVFRAVFWNNDSTPAVALGALSAEFSNSDAIAINSQAKIVGTAFNEDFSSSRAVLWTNSVSPAVDLNSLIPANTGWVLEEGIAINDAGVIAGSGKIGGHTHGFLLVPRVLYSVVDLGALGGDVTESLANNINNNGQIIGGAYAPGFSELHAVFWPNSSSPAASISDLESDAFGINDSGQIIGVTGKIYGPYNAVFWANSSSPAVVLPIPDGLVESFGRGINASGQMSGTGYNEDFTIYRVLVWENSTSTPTVLSGLPAPLDNAAGNTVTRNLNDAGQLVGIAFATTAQGVHAVSWANSSSPAVALGTVNGLPFSYANALNNSGEIVGFSYNTARTVFVGSFWPNSSSPAIALGSLGGELSNTRALGINGDGKIMGIAYGADQSAGRAVLWANSTSPALDLNTVIPSGSGWVLNMPESINDKGTIVGSGTIAGHIQRAFALIPRVQFLSAVSRKMHGTQAFDIPLPLDGPSGIECRSGGASGTHQVIVRFAAPVTFTSAAVSSGSGSVASSTMNGTELVVNLSGVGNAQSITLKLRDVSDGTDTADLAIPMRVLAGDTNGSGGVTASDVSETKAATSPGTVTAANFRTDVNVNGAVNASDVSFVKAKSGNTAP